MTYAILSTIGEVETIASEWADLLDRSACNLAFSSPAWFLTTCRIEPDLTPCVVVAREAGNLRGVLPIALRAATEEACFPSSMCNYNDIVVACDDVDAATGLLDFAISGPKPYRSLTLRWLLTSSNCAKAARLLEPPGEHSFQKERDYNLIRLPASWDDYLQSRSRNFRKGVTQAMRRATDAGLVVRELTPAGFPPQQLPGLFLSLHFSRFGDESAFRPSSPNHQFAKDALPALFTQRRLLVFALFQGTHIIGIDLSLRGYRSLCTWNGGYPSEAERWSPGKLLIGTGIRKAIELGLDEYDLMRGMQDWKSRWANEERSVGAIRLLAR